MSSRSGEIKESSGEQKQQQTTYDGLRSLFSSGDKAKQSPPETDATSKPEKASRRSRLLDALRSGRSSDTKKPGFPFSLPEGKLSDIERITGRSVTPYLEKLASQNHEKFRQEWQDFSTLRQRIETLPDKDLNPDILTKWRGEAKKLREKLELNPFLSQKRIEQIDKLEKDIKLRGLTVLREQLDGWRADLAEARRQHEQSLPPERLGPRQQEKVRTLDRLREKIDAVPDEKLTLADLTKWRRETTAIREQFEQHNMRTGSIDELEQTIESRRLLHSRQAYIERYDSRIYPLNEEDAAIDRLGGRDGAQFIRSETRSIKPEYRSTELHQKDLDGADTEYPDNSGSRRKLIHAAYRNYYNPKTGQFFATENWRNRDRAKMDGHPLPNCEIVINEALDVVGGDLKRLNFTSLTRCIVSNKDSLRVVQPLVKMDETKHFDPASKEGRDILGTPNCISGDAIQEQYRWTIGNKNIKDIRVLRRKDEDYGYDDSADIEMTFASR